MVKIPNKIIKFCQTAIVIPALIFLAFVPQPASATSGSLRSSSIKTCPDGITYGAHGSNLHWHIATRDADGSWSPDGAAITTDPCPGASSVDHNSYGHSNSSASSNSGSGVATQSPQNSSVPSTTAPPASSQASDTAGASSPSDDVPDANQQETSDSLEAPQEDIGCTVQFAGIDSSYNLTTPDQTVTFRYGISRLFFAVTITPADAQLVAVFDGEQSIQSGADITPGEHSLRFVVRDASGHESTFRIAVKRQSFFWTFICPVVVAGIVYLIAYAIIWASFVTRRFGQNTTASTKFEPQKSVQRFQQQLILFPVSLWLKYRKIVEHKAQLRPFYLVARATSIAWTICASIALATILAAFVPARADQLPEPPQSTATTQTAIGADDIPTSTPEESESSFAADTSTDATSDLSPDTSVVADPSDGATPMSGVEIAEAANVPYSRESYQDGWDVGSGCNLRARILQATSIVGVVTSNGCTVTYGSWYDPYTGSTLTGNPYRGDGTANDLDIDHIIPLAYVNAHGGYDWSPSQKKAYGQSLEAYQNGVYVAVSAAENRRKSDSGPSEYYPPNPAYRCEYATKWRDLARIYDISLSRADYEVIEDVLLECAAP